MVLVWDFALLLFYKFTKKENKKSSLLWFKFFNEVTFFSPENVLQCWASQYHKNGYLLRATRYGLFCLIASKMYIANDRGMLMHCDQQLIFKKKCLKNGRDMYFVEKTKMNKQNYKNKIEFNDSDEFFEISYLI